MLISNPLNLLTQKSYWKLFWLAIAITTIIALFPMIKILLIIISLSLLLTLPLDSIIIFLERRKLNRETAIITVYFVIILLMSLTAIFVVPIIHNQIQAMENIETITIWSTLLTKLCQFIQFQNSAEFVNLLSTQFNLISQFLINRSNALFPNEISITLFIIVIPIMTFLLLRDGEAIKKSLVAQLPNRYFELSLAITSKISRIAKNWLKESLIIFLCISVTSIIGLYSLGFPHFLIIGLIIGLTYLIPLFGVYVACLLTMLFISTTSLKALIGIIIALATIKLFHTFIFTKKTTESVSYYLPLLLLIGLVIGCLIGGIIGLLLLVPLGRLIFQISREIHLIIKQYQL
jgi:predicted PurR-regulated permease PerM